MDEVEVEVDVVEGQPSAGLLEGRESLLEAVVPAGQLGQDTDLLSGDSRSGDGQADVLLVAVGSAGVDQAVAGPQSVPDGVL